MLFFDGAIVRVKSYFCGMLNSDEESFLEWWKKNGEREKTSVRPLLIGLSGGLILGICIVLMLVSNWDPRATMVANSQLSSVVLVIGIMIISVIMAFLYRNFRWEMQEQRYLELKAKKNRI
jgi:membrane protein YdbS with pleckstrin-like domain